MNRSYVVAAALGIALLVGDAHATEEATVVVYQPIWTENGLDISPVTYIRMLGSAWPGIAISMVADSNAVVREGRRASNRNAATWCNIHVGLLPRTWPSVNFIDPVDTLSVLLDLSHLKSVNRAYMGNVDVSTLEIDWVVAATVECILTNAALGHPPARFLDLRVKGPSTYGRFQQVFRLKSLGVLPRRSLRFWGSGSGPELPPSRR